MRLRSVVLTMISLLVVSTTYAQSGYPQPRDNYVNDFANVLSAEAETYIRTQLAAVESGDQIEMSVVTIASIGDYNTSARSFEAFATGLFNAWGIGDATRGDGILLLVAVADRDVRVELGEAYTTANNNDAQDILDENILPAFRRGDYQTGIVNGTRALINEFTGVLPPLPPSGVTQSQPAQTFTPPAADEDDDGDQSGIALLVLILVILGGWWLIRSLSAYSSDDVADGWEGDSDSDDTWDRGDDDRSSSHTRRSWTSSSSRRSSSSHSSSSSSSRRSSFGGGRSKGGGASGKW